MVTSVKAKSVVKAKSRAVVKAKDPPATAAPRDGVAEGVAEATWQSTSER